MKELNQPAPQKNVGLVLAMAVVVFASVMFAVPSEAGEIGAFLTMPTPRDLWKTGFGFHAAIISLPFLQAGAEFAHAGAENPTVVIDTYTAQAELNPPTPKIKPFIGIGVGAYREKTNDVSDWGTLTTIFGGLRIPIGAAKLRAEVRKVALSGTPKVNFDKRFSLGISFGF